MEIAIISYHHENYKALGDITWANKEEYAKRHGYKHFCKTNNFYGVHSGFEKIWFIRDLFKDYQELEWIWYTDCDNIVTNMTIPIENRIDNNYHFIIATDCNGMNAGSFLIRNSPEGNSYLQMFIDRYDDYKHDGLAEQRAMWNTAGEFQSITKIIPQRDINSHDYTLYKYGTGWGQCVPWDKLGLDGQWKKGDLLLHWPGQTLEQRLDLTNKYLPEVVR